jgi:predicted  nucleic acid-binding Zn-ribbon protein
LISCEHAEDEKKEDHAEDHGMDHGMMAADADMPKGEEHAADDAPAEAAADDTPAADSVVKAKLKDSFMAKKASEEKEAIRWKVRRAYDLAMKMQRKGMIPGTSVALDDQVDTILQFDDGAFEAFKQAVDHTRVQETTKIASDLGGINVGVESDEAPAQMSGGGSYVEQLSSALWGDK